MIDWARGGCRESFGQLAERCRAYLLHVANRELGDDLQAKIGGSDLVQETLLQGQQAVGRFRGQTEGEIRAWLRQILLHNVARSGRRYRGAAMRDIGRELPLDGSDEGRGFVQELGADLATPSKELMARERITALKQAIERLSAAHRQAIVLRNVEHLSFESIGQEMQRTPEAARKLWARAVIALQQKLAASDVSR
jgi:RNA polymerase sigma-70 factor (ECF subfamily)